MNLNNNPSSNNYPLIIECCRIDPDSEKLESLARTITDWDSVLSSAYAHGVYPLIAKSLKTIIAVPDTIKSDLKKISFHIARENMQKGAELIRVVKAIEEEGIQVLAIKGPILSQIIHGDITTRQYADIDVLIPKESIYRAGKILLNHGFNSVRSIEFLKNQTLFNVAKDFSIINSEKKIHIEFHWQLFLPREIKKAKLDIFALETPCHELNTKMIKTLNPDINLFYLLLHGSKHMWERLEWIVDIDRLIRRREHEIDWDRLDKLAQDMEVEVMYIIGLAMANEIFKTPLKQRHIDEIERTEKILSAKRVILKELLNDSILKKVDKETAFRNLYKMQFNKENKLAIFRHYWMTLTGIKSLDVYTINLPNWCSFLYYPIRILRLIRFYIFR